MLVPSRIFILILATISCRYLVHCEVALSKNVVKRDAGAYPYPPPPYLPPQYPPPQYPPPQYPPPQYPPPQYPPPQYPPLQYPPPQYPPPQYLPLQYLPPQYPPQQPPGPPLPPQPVEPQLPQTAAKKQPLTAVIKGGVTTNIKQHNTFAPTFGNIGDLNLGKFLFGDAPDPDLYDEDHKMEDPQQIQSFLIGKVDIIKDAAAYLMGGDGVDHSVLDDGAEKNDDGEVAGNPLAGRELVYDKTSKPKNSKDGNDVNIPLPEKEYREKLKIKPNYQKLSLPYYLPIEKKYRKKSRSHKHRHVDSRRKYKLDYLRFLLTHPDFHPQISI